MWLRPGNLVRHKTGGPIMMVTAESPYVLGGDGHFQCTWTESGERKVAEFHLSTLQPVYADGSPRDDYEHLPRGPQPQR
jgi:uncharacterized protein YodC (DUF2158 family)